MFILTQKTSWHLKEKKNKNPEIILIIIIIIKTGVTFWCTEMKNDTVVILMFKYEAIAFLTFQLLAIFFFFIKLWDCI